MERSPFETGTSAVTNGLGRGVFKVGHAEKIDEF
jgi:hypothetical protein